MLEMMFDSFNKQSIEVALPDFPEEPTSFGVKVRCGAGAEGPPYETAEMWLEAVHVPLTATGYDCGESRGTGFSCEVETWSVLIEDVEAPVVGPDGATIVVAVVPPAPG